MENNDAPQCVRVAVNIRPLITSELMLGCTDCISVVPGEPQVDMFSFESECFVRVAFAVSCLCLLLSRIILYYTVCALFLI